MRDFYNILFSEGLGGLNGGISFSQYNPQYNYAYYDHIQNLANAINQQAKPYVYEGNTPKQDNFNGTIIDGECERILDVPLLVEKKE